MLQAILDKIDPNIKLYVTASNNKIYYSNMIRENTIFALNTILVIEKTRLSYRMSVDANNEQNLNPYYAGLALNFDNNLTSYDGFELPLYPSEPLIFLKENEEQIMNIFNNESDGHIAYGKVLGYSYTGPDWCGMSSGDTYGISYIAVNENNDKFCLFTFNIPVCEYNIRIRDEILSNRNKFQAVLDKYGYSVTFDTLIQTRDDVTLIDRLPEY